MSTAFQAGRFVLVYGRDSYVTSWDTWEQAEAAFPIESQYRLEDGETGSVWHPGAPYEWEAAETEYERERELRGLWLSRVMFNPFVGWPAETRTYEEWRALADEEPQTRPAQRSGDRT